MVIQGDLTKRRHLSAHFGLKYLSNSTINRDRFHCKSFPKIHTFRSAKKSRANFEWSVPLIKSIMPAVQVSRIIMAVVGWPGCVTTAPTLYTSLAVDARSNDTGVQSCTRLDYCNALLYGAPVSCICMLQRAQYNAARIILHSVLLLNHYHISCTGCQSNKD